MKTEQEKADEIRKKRELARKGLAEHPDDCEEKDSLEEQEERQEKIADNGLAIGLGLRRSG